MARQPQPTDEELAAFHAWQAQQAADAQAAADAAAAPTAAEAGPAPIEGVHVAPSAAPPPPPPFEGVALAPPAVDPSTTDPGAVTSVGGVPQGDSGSAPIEGVHVAAGPPSAPGGGWGVQAPVPSGAPASGTAVIVTGIADEVKGPLVAEVAKELATILRSMADAVERATA